MGRSIENTNFEDYNDTTEQQARLSDYLTSVDSSVREPAHSRLWSASDQELQVCRILLALEMISAEQVLHVDRAANGTEWRQDLPENLREVSSNAEAWNLVVESWLLPNIEIYRRNRKVADFLSSVRDSYFRNSGN